MKLRRVVDGVRRHQTHNLLRWQCTKVRVSEARDPRIIQRRNEKRHQRVSITPQ